MTYNTRFTEECPLTKEKNYRYKLGDCCSNGLQLIIICFITLTFAITTMLVLQILYTENIPQNRHGIHGAVATDNSYCSQIGTKILRKSGNAIDAAVAATICMAVVSPHKTGLGGGGYIMIYNDKNHSFPFIIDFATNTVKGSFGKAGLRLPALLQGLDSAHRLFGSLPWYDVVRPAAELARKGFIVSQDLVDEVSRNPDHGPLNPGNIVKRFALASTLDIVAEHGANALYNSTLSYKILQTAYNILPVELLQQLANYQPITQHARSSMLHRHEVYYPPRTIFMRRVIETLESLPIVAANASTVESQSLIAETLMHLYLSSSPDAQQIKRETYTGVTAIDWQDTYVCILSGLSSPFGNKTDAGFHLDMSTDENSLSTFIPIIFYPEIRACGLRGTFGSDDAFLNGQILYNLIVRALNVSTAIEYPRYYYVSDGIVIENNQRYSMETALQLRLRPMISSLPVDDGTFMKSINAILKREDLLSSHSDSRGNGIASRF